MSKDEEDSDLGSLDYYLFRAALKRFQLPPSELTSAQREEIHRLALREYALVSKILSSEEARNIVIPDQLRDVSMAALEARYESREDLLADLRRHGLHEKMLLQALQCQLKVDAVLKHICSRLAPVTEREARRYYHRHRERFERPETRTVGHILITVNEDFPENRAEIAYERINQILQWVRSESSRFTEQARKHSECPSALRGGKLGRISRGKLYAALDSVLFKLRSGEISDIVQSPVGFHILYCEMIHSREFLPVKRVLPRIMQILNERRRRRYQQSWLLSL